jgi:hypothetical protein
MRPLRPLRPMMASGPAGPASENVLLQVRETFGDASNLLRATVAAPEAGALASLPQHRSSTRSSDRVKIRPGPQRVNDRAGQAAAGGVAGHTLAARQDSARSSSRLEAHGLSTRSSVAAGLCMRHGCRAGWRQPQ